MNQLPEHSTRPRVRSAIAFGLLFAILLAMQLSMIVRSPAAWESWVSAGVFVAVFLVLYKSMPREFVLLALFMISQLGAVLSCAYIESGNFIVEQSTFGYPTGSTVRLVLFDSLFLLAAAVLLRRAVTSEANPATLQKSTRNTYFFIYSGLMLVLSVGLYVTGVPLFMGLDRFTFGVDHPFPVMLTLGGQLYAGALGLGMLYVQGYRKGSAALFSMSLLYMILQSEKFSGLIMLAYMFALPLLLHKMKSIAWRPSVSRLGVTALVAGLLLGGLVAYHYNTINVAAGSSVGEALANRALGLQGHVWWGVDSEYVVSRQGADLGQLATELKAVAGGVDDRHDVGMKHLMSRVAPPALVSIYHDRGVNFTMGYPAINLVVGGYGGLAVLQLLAALITAATFAYLYRKIASGQLVRALLAAKIAIEVYAVFTMGNWFDLTSWKMIFYVGAVSVLELLTRVYGENHRPVAGRLRLTPGEVTS